MNNYNMDKSNYFTILKQLHDICRNNPAPKLTAMDAYNEIINFLYLRHLSDNCEIEEQYNLKTLYKNYCKTSTSEASRILYMIRAPLFFEQRFEKEVEDGSGDMSESDGESVNKFLSGTTTTTTTTTKKEMPWIYRKLGMLPWTCLSACRAVRAPTRR